MARKSTKSVTDTATVEDTTVAVDEVTENIKATTKEKALSDLDEIKVVSLIPNVSYKDDRTNDMYEWDEVGHVEYMTVETLKNMWRNHKGYFRNMWLKPVDNRVIKLFGLGNIYDKFEFLMDEKNYTRDNISSVCDAFKTIPNDVKYALSNKIRSLVSQAKISDVVVIKTLEKALGLDLTSMVSALN